MKIDLGSDPVSDEANVFEEMLPGAYKFKIVNAEGKVGAKSKKHYVNLTLKTWTLDGEESRKTFGGLYSRSDAQSCKDDIKCFCHLAKIPHSEFDDEAYDKFIGVSGIVVLTYADNGFLTPIQKGWFDQNYQSINGSTELYNSCLAAANSAVKPESKKGNGKGAANGAQSTAAMMGNNSSPF